MELVTKSSMHELVFCDRDTAPHLIQTTYFSEEPIPVIRTLKIPFDLIKLGRKRLFAHSSSQASVCQGRPERARCSAGFEATTSLRISKL
jgi:hypothetical protein